MKRLFVLLLALTMVLGLCACGNSPKASSITIDQFEEEMSLVLRDDAKFTKREDKDGYSITCNTSYVNSDLVITGKTDKKEHLYLVSTKLSDAFDMKYLRSLDVNQVGEDIIDWRNVPMNKLACSFYVMQCAGMVSALSSNLPDGATDQFGTISIVFDAMKENTTFAGWEYSFDFDEDNDAATFNAAYVG